MRTTWNNRMDPPSPYDEEDSPVRFKVTLTNEDSEVLGEYEITQEHLDDIDRGGIEFAIVEVIRDVKVIAKQRGLIGED